MSDLISRKALIGILTKYKFGAIKSESEREYTKETVLNFVKEQPTVEAKEVVHGEWRHIGGDEWGCTSCGHVISTEGSWEKPTAKFCEECGCDMRTSAE